MRDRINRFVMVIAGLLLVVAAVLKSRQLLTTPIITEGFWESWLFFMVQVPLEFGLGIWLLSGLFRKAAWLLATISFGLFVCVTFYKGISGAESCGCFGNVHVNPWITLLTMDVPVFLGLVIFRPGKEEKLLPPPWPDAGHFWGVFAATMCLYAVLIPTLIQNRPVRESWIEQGKQQHKPILSNKDKDGGITKDIDKTGVAGGNGSVRTNDAGKVKPADKDRADSSSVSDKSADDTAKTAETGKEIQTANNSDAGKTVETVRNGETAKQGEQSKKQWEWLDDIDIADSLKTGLVVVFMYRHDCPTCHDAIPVYNDFSKDLEPIKLAFVELPPFGDGSDSPVPSDTKCLTGKFKSNKERLVATPFIVVLLDGVVQRVWESEAPSFDELMEAIFGNS